MASDSLIENNFSKDVLEKANSFMHNAFKNVLGKYSDEKEKDKLRGILQSYFYNFFIEVPMLKIFIYKLKQFVLKKHEKEYSKEFDQVTRKNYENAKAFTKKYLDETIKLTINKYNQYIVNKKKASIIIQKYYRGYLYRLIHKMELMNHKMMIESQKMMQRARSNSIRNKASAKK